ncbi:molecular chaperone DnaK (HSP70)/uncharacterized caspase-like protein [Catenulispora sp. GAS73]|uniref:Hsp70 family protein n=1 Tax=Catenulispora sp. GAS73 TaxID=3156269 RepID=UPI0035116AEB
MNAAIVIGCSQYDDPEIDSLEYAHRDAARFSDVLRDVCGVPAGAIKLFCDPDPSSGSADRLAPNRANILRGLAAARNQGPLDGTLFFFFSGHGYQTADGIQYLLPADSVRHALDDSALRFDRVLNYLDCGSARHIVMFIDACRNVMSSAKGVPDEYRQLDVANLFRRGMVSICSCEPTTVSYEVAALRSGVFTEALCQALSPVGHCRTVDELVDFVGRAVPEIARQHDKPVQQPYSRVEPLELRRLELVSDRTRNLWRSTVPLGSEQRPLGPARPHKAVPATDREPIVAIDLGTSYSAVSVAENGQVRLLPTPDDRLLLPSVVHILPDLNYRVGTAAAEAGRLRPQNTIRNMKRALGTNTEYEIEGRSITPELAASLILRSLRDNAQDTLGIPVRRCVASCPASFSIAQRTALERAYELADLEIVRMIGEPSAATLALRRERTGNYFVVDLGGGTFDVSVVAWDLDEGDGFTVAEVQSVAGSAQVGGIDYDEAVVGFVENELKTRYGLDLRPQNFRLREELHRAAEGAKRDLSTRGETTLLIRDVEIGQYGLSDLEIPISRQQFRDATNHLNTRVANVLQKGLKHLNHKRYQPDTAVFLAGQGSKIFTVREEIEKMGLDIPVVSTYQETAVVFGLGHAAGVLNGQVRDALLLDVTHRELGLCVAVPPTKFTRVEPIFPQNASFPIKRYKSLATRGSEEPQQLIIIENGDGHQAETAAVIELPTGDTDRNIEIVIEIDANATIIFGVDDPERRAMYSVQLNNLRRCGRNSLYSTYPEKWLLRLLDGWSAWPTVPINGTRVTTVPDASAPAPGFDPRTELDLVQAEWSRQGDRRAYRGFLRELTGSLEGAAEDLRGWLQDNDPNELVARLYAKVLAALDARTTDTSGVDRDDEQHRAG